MNTPIKQIQQASDIIKYLNANPAYNEYNVWRQNMQSGRSYPISEQTLDAVLEGDKSALSLLIDQLSFYGRNTKRIYKGAFQSYRNRSFE